MQQLLFAYSLQKKPKRIYRGCNPTHTNILNLTQRFKSRVMDKFSQHYHCFFSINHITETNMKYTFQGAHMSVSMHQGEGAVLIHLWKWSRQLFLRQYVLYMTLIRHSNPRDQLSDLYLLNSLFK